MRRAWCVGVGLGLFACGGSVTRSNEPTTAKTSESAAHPCARAHAQKVPVPVSANGAGSVVGLAARDATTIAYVADEDTATLYTVEAGSLKELAATPLRGKPSQLLLHSDGRVFVAIAGGAQVEVLEPGTNLGQPLEHRCSLETPAEPVALAWTPREERLLVTSGWGHALTAYDTKSFERSLEVDLPRDPRSVVVSDDGTKAYVAHATGSQLSLVALTRSPSRAASLWVGTPGKVDTEMDGNRAQLRVSSQRFGSQGFALAKEPGTTGRILAPQVLVDRGNLERPTSSGYSDSRVPQMASVAVLDEDAGSVLPSSLDDSLDSAVNLGWGEPQVKECLLPRVALVDPKGESLFVGCLGVDQVVEYDAMSADPRRAEIKRWGVPAGPTGLALDPKSRRLYVWSQFDRTLSVVDIARDQSDPDDLDPGLVQLVLSRPAGQAMQGDVALGRKLFHDVGNLEISADGRACASCHIEGRDDGLTWATPDGPRQTPVLMGRLTGTAPFGWTGNGEKLSEHMQKTFSRLGGKGLEGDELSAMLAYVASLAPPAGVDAEGASEIARGRELFHAAETGCATCHAGDTLTDGQRHNVKSAAAGDGAKAFDTPSLLHIRASAPYFHDGRFANLRDMLEATSGMMGKTSHLSATDKNALVAYLETL